MAATTTPKSKPVVRIGVGTPEARVVDIVDRTARLSDQLLRSFESSERAAIKAMGQFVVSVEEAIPTEVTSTTDVAKKITESGLETIDQLVHIGYEGLRHASGSAATWLTRHDGAKAVAA